MSFRFRFLDPFGNVDQILGLTRSNQKTSLFRVSVFVFFGRPSRSMIDGSENLIPAVVVDKPRAGGHDINFNVAVACNRGLGLADKGAIL